jgi:hypothetical protein
MRAAGATPEICRQLARYGLAIGIAFQFADDRDDGELSQHAAAATARIHDLCAEAHAIAKSLGPSAWALRDIATWMGSKA